ncbi:class I SAM-dependent methyltransferase [Deinococcus altitudinis]|uniref:class I SAM-dependent methyltransferase n=1 Tax=Deinococcus altitudinis TaxID=468914 RepID=UPI0038925E1B
MDGVTVPGQLEESLNPPASAPRSGRQGGGVTPGGLTAAQRSNLLTLTATGYMSWRVRSLSLLTGTAFGLQREAALFRARCAPQPGENWLDVGTSGGWYAGLLAADGARVLACDLSPAMLKVAARLERSHTIDYALLNAEATGLPDGSFDGVTIGATLNETGSAEAMLRESARLLRGGGQLWVMYLARNGGPSQAALSALGGLSFPDPAELPAWLPGMRRSDLLRVREVVFERWIKDGPVPDRSRPARK